MRNLNMDEQRFPVSAGIFFGLGLGGFFDGIVFHQILQWHHMLTSAGYPPNSVHNLKVDTFWDGIFHAATYVFVLIGLVILWHAAHRGRANWSSKLLIGSVLVGFGLFNLVEGIIDHHLLKDPRSNKLGNLAAVAGCNARRTVRRSASTASDGQRSSVPATASKIAELIAARVLRSTTSTKPCHQRNGSIGISAFCYGGPPCWAAAGCWYVPDEGNS